MLNGILIAVGITLPIALLMYDMIISKKRLDILETEVTTLRTLMRELNVNKDTEKFSKGDEAYNILRTNAKRIGLSHCFK
jgi:hypothetical protein